MGNEVAITSKGLGNKGLGNVINTMMNCKIIIEFVDHKLGIHLGAGSFQTLGLQPMC